jgi:hypothetical protein
MPDRLAIFRANDARGTRPLLAKRRAKHSGSGDRLATGIDYPASFPSWKRWNRRAVDEYLP